MRRLAARLAVTVVTLATATAACGGASPGASSAATVASQAAGDQSTAPSQTTAAAAGGSAGASSWPADLPMPAGVAVVGDVNGESMWTGGTAQAIHDALLAEAKAAGYTVFAGGSADVEFTMYFVKPPDAFHASVMEGAVQGSRVGLMHLTATGSEPLDLDLPMTYGNPRPFGDFNVGVNAPSDKCAGCSYLISLRIGPHDFKGPGPYELAVIEFGALQVGSKNNYQFPTSCHIAVTDDKTGTFACKGLREQASQATEDVSGSWTTPKAE